MLVTSGIMMQPLTATKQLSHNDYTVAWICALPHEKTAARNMLDELHINPPQPEYDKNIYTFGGIHGHNVVIVCQGDMGTTAAATVATRMDMVFRHLRFGLLVGIAGGVPDKKDVRLGDVIISKGDGVSGGVVTHDRGKVTEMGFQTRPFLNGVPEVLRNAFNELASLHMDQDNKIPEYISQATARNPRFRQFNWPNLDDYLYKSHYVHVDPMDVKCDQCNKNEEYIVTRNIRDGPKNVPFVHFGTIASGNQVIKSAAERAGIAATHPGVLAVEMEAAGLMNVFGCATIRGICDYADSHKNDGWQNYAAATAAACAREVLEIIPTMKLEAMPAISAVRAPIFLVPFPRDSYFVGRYTELRSLEDMLSRESNRFTEAAIVGLGGVGKTQIANEYAHRQYEKEKQKGPHDRQSIIWIHASSQARVEHSFKDIARKLNLISDQQITEDVFPAVKDWFQGNDSGKWLLIMDNADDEEVFFKPFVSKNPLLHTGITRRLCDFLPEKSNCTILYTSRHHTCACELLKRTYSSKIMEVPMMSMEDSVRLLKNELGILGTLEALTIDELSMQRLVLVLGNLPLAITQAASFMRVNDLTPEVYTSLYDEMETEQEAFLTEEFFDWRRDSDMPNAVLLTWKLSFEQIRRKNEVAVKVLSILSVLDRHGLPDWMFPYFPGVTRLQVLIAIALLKSFSFVTRQDNSMHRLVQVATRAWIGPEAWRSAVQDALRFLCNVFARLNSNDWASEKLSDYTIRRSLEYYPHTKSVLAALSTVRDEDLTRSTINGFLDEWGTGDLASERFVKKANEVYQEVITGDYRSLTDMIRLVRALSGGSMRYFVKLYRGPYESTDQYDRYFSDLKDAEYDHTSLSWAAQYGDETVVKQLLRTGKVDVNAKDSEYGRTPLSRAAEYGQVAVVKLLLETGQVDVDSKDSEYRRTPLSWASGNGHEAVVKMLLETGRVNIESQGSRYGQTPLSLAAENGHEAVVKLLLATGKVHVDSRDRTNWTPLLQASRNGHDGVVKLLLETGNVDVDSKESVHGRTPLSWAAGNGHEAVVKLLLETGKVNVDSKDPDLGRTPLSWATENGHNAIVKLLETKLANSTHQIATSQV